MSGLAVQREQNLRQIENLWPRSAWDYRGISRWLSFDESYWASMLAAGLLLSATYLDVLVLWGGDAPLMTVVGELGGSPASRALLLALILVNGWILDRILTARIPSGLREVRWLRVARTAAAAIPLLGLAVFPLWLRLLRSPPLRAFIPKPAGPLDLDGELPARFGFSGLQTRVGVWLRSWSQRRSAQIFWVVGCQITTLFSCIGLFAKQRALALALCVILHLAGACAALAYVALRTPRLQMTGGRAAVFRLLPLALLLPAPFSFLIALLWFSASEERKEQSREIVEALYRTRVRRRHPLAAIRVPRLDEIAGDREAHRRRSLAAKIVLLALESSALAGIAAVLGSPLLPVWTDDGLLLFILLILPALPGAFLLLAGGAERISGRWPKLAFLNGHPYGASLTLVPLALTLGLLAGTLAGVDDRPALHQLLILVGLAGFQATLLVVMWTFLLTLFSGAPERPYAGMIVWFMSFVLVLLLSPFLADPTVFRSLSIFAALAGPLLSVTIASSWLAPFRFRDLTDRRLPTHLRTQLWGLSITAILPLGGLAVPAWLRMRHLNGSELDRWAARLREPAV